jgi:hypothetical protein
MSSDADTVGPTAVVAAADDPELDPAVGEPELQPRSSAETTVRRAAAWSERFTAPR